MLTFAIRTRADWVGTGADWVSMRTYSERHFNVIKTWTYWPITDVHFDDISWHDPFRPNFAFFLLLLTAIHLYAKFEVSSFILARDIRGSQNSKKWVTWPPRDSFWLNFAFFVSTHCNPFEVSSMNRSGDIRASQNSKSGSRNPHMTPFDLILHFFVSIHCRPYMCQIWSF